LVTSGVEVLDVPTATPRRVFYDSTAWMVTGQSISPTGEFLAVVRYEPGRIEGTGYGLPPFPTTVVLEASTGAVVMSIPRGISAVWCGEECLTVLYGVYVEGSEVGVLGDSMTVFNVVAGHPLLTVEPVRWQIAAPAWRPSDSSIVYRGAPRGRWETRKLDLRTGEQASESFGRGESSGSGRFFRHYEEGRAWVTSTDDTSVIAVPLEGVWQVEEWLGRTDKVLLIKLTPRVLLPRGTPGGGPRPIVRDTTKPNPERVYRIWDVASGEISEEWSAAETQWRGPAPNGCRLFMKDRRLTAAPGCK